MENLKLANLRIRTKLLLGFGLMLGIIAVVAVIVWANLAQVRHQADTVTARIQPAMMDAMELARELDAANKSLGFYLLSTEALHRDAYLASSNRVGELMKALQGSALAKDDPLVRQQLEALSTSLSRTTAMGERILPLATDNLANQPGFTYAAQNLNPYSQQIAQLLSQMVISERNEPSSPARRELLLLLGEMRYNWGNVMSSLRGYLAFRTDSTLDEINAYHNSVGRQLDELENLDYLFTFEQEDAAEQLVEAYQTFIGNLPELVELHGSDRWRTDAWLIRTELGDNLQAVQRDLEQLLGHLRQAINSHGGSLMSQTDTTRQGVLVMAILALLVGVFAVWWLNRMIVLPINRAAVTMDDIAQGDGDLTCRLNMQTQDELGRMCSAFNRFVGKIRDIIGPVSDSTTRLAEAADNMSSITLQTRQGVERQQQETEQVATAMNEMVATAQDMVDSAGMAADATREADAEAREGANVVRLTINQINALANAVGQAAEVIHRLEEDSTSIGTVLDVIGGSPNRPTCWP